MVGVFVGHLLRLLMPRSWTAAVGVSDPAYRLTSVTASTLAGATMLAGLVLLIARRILHARVARTTTVTDVVMYLTLGIVVLLGIWATVRVNVPGPSHDFREAVAAWFRSVFLLHPDRR